MTTPSGDWHAHQRDRTWTCDGPSPEATAFHRGLPDYAPTPLLDLPSLARELDVGRVLVKDESSRLGLPAFKALGASWAVYRALRDYPAGETTTVVAATDGNHGRAVAHFAHALGHRAIVVLPDGVHPAAAQAIRDEGADVRVVGGSYDSAVAIADDTAQAERGILIQDTSWEGYTDVPGWIVEGYATLFAEVDQRLRTRSLGTPHLVVVPVGVGSLLHAAISHYRGSDAAQGTAIVSAEAQAAACLPASLRTGRPVTVRTRASVMSGLNCGTPSALAWPYIVRGLDAAVAVSDDDDLQAARDLAALGVSAGPCGAASLAAARLALTGAGSDRRRSHLGLEPESIVVLVSTEGVDANPLPQDTPPADGDRRDQH
jgi:diaminopropionate ammonia-lyase